MKIQQLTAALALALPALLIAAPGTARNVDLTTVPPRESVQLTIYNSEDLTLVREIRHLTLKKGVNSIQYSWAGTLIDPTSVELRVMENDRDVEVLDTTFPADKPQHLIWSIDSKIEGEVKFQVTYFTSGLSWSADYTLVCNADETEMSFDGYVQIANQSGEDYENAQVRLVVGVVNLVEKIQDLARRGVPVPSPDSEAYETLRKQVMAGAVVAGERPRLEPTRPPEIVKEGLSEYFIYTIEGWQTLPNNWSKRLASFRARQVRFEHLYRLRTHQYGPQLVRFLTLKNDAEHHLGTTPLPDGIVRVFRDTGRDGLGFLAQQSIKYVPIKEDIELNIGTDDEVTIERTRSEVERSQFTFSPEGHVIGWDERAQWHEQVRNHRNKPIRIEVRHQFPGDVEIRSETAKVYDYQTIEFSFHVGPRRDLGWSYQCIQHVGKNEAQKRIRLAG